MKEEIKDLSKVLVAALFVFWEGILIMEPKR